MKSICHEVFGNATGSRIAMHKGRCELGTKVVKMYGSISFVIHSRHTITITG